MLFYRLSLLSLRVVGIILLSGYTLLFEVVEARGQPCGERPWFVFLYGYMQSFCVAPTAVCWEQYKQMCYTLSLAHVFLYIFCHECNKSNTNNLLDFDLFPKHDATLGPSNLYSILQCYTYGINQQYMVAVMPCLFLRLLQEQDISNLFSLVLENHFNLRSY